MADHTTIQRRRMLRDTALILVGSTGLAGCLSDDNGGSPTVEATPTVAGLEPIDIPSTVERDVFANHLNILEHSAFADDDLVVIRGEVKSDQDTTGEGTSPRITATFFDSDDAELGTDEKAWDSGMEDGETRAFTLRYEGGASDVAEYHLYVESNPG